jgi:hypothetical protein
MRTRILLALLALSVVVALASCIARVAAETAASIPTVATIGR